MTPRRASPVTQLYHSPISALLTTNGRAFGAVFLVGAAVGLTALGLPHGTHFNDRADLVISGLAAGMGTWSWHRTQLGPRTTSALLCLGTLAVSAGVYSGTGDYVSVSAAVIYIWLALLASLFMSARRTWAHLGVIAVSYGAVLTMTGNSGAPAEWLFITGTAAVTALVTLAIRTELVSMCERDPLTGLPNRAGLNRVLEREIAKARRDETTFAIAIIDLDSFKALNDKQGHLAGDEALVSTSRAWQATLRGNDVLARFGGDEFVVVLPGSGVLQAGRILRRMRRSNDTWEFSAGLACWYSNESLDQLIARADMALYVAKARRRSQKVVLARRPCTTPVTPRARNSTAH